MHKLHRIDFNALGHYDHLCRELAIAILGKAGTGKTELVRRHANANRLPFVELSPRALRSTQDIFREVDKVCKQNGVPLVELKERYYALPPVNIFIDEVHALAPNIVQGLLKATEYKDAILVTEDNITVNCFNVHWIIATTDRGKLFDAFDTRFMKINLTMYNKQEIAQIIKFNYPDWSEEACNLVSHYSSRVPREALSFAREMKLEFDMRPDKWENIASKIAEDNDIDPFGMTYQRLKILKALAEKPISSKRLPIIAGCKEEELDKFVLPWLLETTEDQEPLVGVCQKGYVLTEAGRKELEKRAVPRNQETIENIAV